MGQMMNMNPMMNPMMHDMGMGVGGDMGRWGTRRGPQGGGQNTPDQQVQMGMGVGEGFGPGGAPGQGMMGMGMGGEFGMQDPSMGQQMYPGMEGSSTPGQTPTPTRGVVAPGQFRGRGMPQGMGLRGRGGGFVGRGRALPVRPASPLPPNVPTGPRNKNKYKDIDGSAPAVDGLDYGGGGMKEGGRGTPDADERSNSRKRRSSPGLDEGRGSKRR
ncbi:hypothetical protein A0H81_01358 [Grifola frondosa]|uniref:Uncharacterized protein n=1 Tax=Grifola frondosa TaxID=5627 RepID=A0A1C7MR12_GRIFR|nr:hypothetical protein A0H81_01358 [Grifola frondosa]